ncbi:fumarylacetoacetate hydrolase family protein [Candidatus Bipolaricaulota bacterium]|nr:fumarylacetoacetate hydrolase family protein [Candidatus Bipolaricaulota bacterium]
MRIAVFQVEGLTVRGEVVGEEAVGLGRRWPLSQVKLLAPVRPTKVVCLGRNYAAHARELDNDLPERPLLFFKPPSAVIGPGEAIVLPPSPRVDYEGELAVVIGRRCRNVRPDQASQVILGYTCLNDVTDREAQGWEGNWVRAKGFDTSCPIGPWIVTPDELSFPLTVETYVNGELRQRGSTDELLFPIPEVIAEISSVMTLEEGDVIATGTPAGVGPLHPGDTVEVRISGIGSLKNPVKGG